MRKRVIVCGGRRGFGKVGGGLRGLSGGEVGGVGMKAGVERVGG